MATAPFPFFYTPPYAYPCAAAYPPTASGFSTAPVHAFPPAFPCAATYPAHNPTYGSASCPSAATYHHPFPVTFPSPIPSQIDPSRPPPAPTPIHGDLHQTVAEPLVLPYPPVLTPPPESSAPPATDSSSPSPHHHHFPSTTDHFPVQAAPQPSAVATTQCRERRPPQSHASSTRSGPTPLTPTTTCSSSAVNQSTATSVCAPVANEVGTYMRSRQELTRTTADERAQAKDETRELLQRELLNIQARLDQQQARERTSFDTIQGELAKLSSMASQLAVAMGMPMTDAPISGSSLAALSAPMSSFAPSMSSGATACVAREVFAEMPLPYGFDNLTGKTVFRADGSEHSYFALPENYPLELATPEPMFNVYDEETDGCSNEFVHVFPSTLEQQPYEGEQQADQLLKCVSKATKFKQTSACLNTASDVQVLSLELQQQDDERAFNCSDLKASDSFVTRCSQLSVERSRIELRLLWDPGASAYVHASKLRVSQWKVLVTRGRSKQWDPGDIELQVLVSTAASATKLQCRDVYKSAMVHLLAVKFGAHNYTYSSDTVAIMCDPPANLIQQRRPIAALRHFRQYKLLSSDVDTWDPGITFVHQQSVYGNCNAKNLLSSENYLHIWEMDITFITFLPP